MQIYYLKINHILFLLVIQSFYNKILYFTDAIVFNSVLSNYNISIIPLAFGGYPHNTNFAVPGIHLVTKGVKFKDLFKCSIIWGAFVVCIFYIY